MQTIHNYKSKREKKFQSQHYSDVLKPPSAKLKVIRSYNCPDVWLLNQQPACPLLPATLLEDIPLCCPSTAQCTVDSHSIRILALLRAGLAREALSANLSEQKTHSIAILHLLRH